MSFSSEGLNTPGNSTQGHNNIFSELPHEDAEGRRSNIAYSSRK